MKIEGVGPNLKYFENILLDFKFLKARYVK